MGRCVQRTDQDESFENESAEFMRIAARPSATHEANLVKCSYQLKFGAQSASKYMWRSDTSDANGGPKTLKTAGLRSHSEQQSRGYSACEPDGEAADWQSRPGKIRKCNLF
jgi:hypothetical protein